VFAILLVVPGDPTAAITAAAALFVDVVTVEVSSALEAGGIPSVVVRGPSIARHLYGSREIRRYGDVDLLVPLESRATAAAVIKELGFTDMTGLGRRPDDRPPWSSTWGRLRDGGNVDLHWTVPGMRAVPETVWLVLQREGMPLRVAESEVTGLNAQATAVVVALHAAHHGIRAAAPLDDLRRAVHQWPDALWREALSLARELDATIAFAIGLRLDPAGAELADRLRLPAASSTELILRSGTAPPMALGFDWLDQTSGLGSKARLAWGKVVPDAAFMRVWSPLARGGSRTGLALAYAWRPVWLLLHAAPGYRSWRAARREAERRAADAGP
jgi:hypothetical protein